MIIHPQMMRSGSAASYVKPDLLYAYEFDGLNVIESMSGADTGVDWGTSATPYGQETYHGITGWRQSTGPDAAVITYTPGDYLYAFGFQLLFCSGSPYTYASASFTPFYISGVEVRIGGFTSLLSNELLTLYNGYQRTAYCSTTDSIDPGSRVEEIFTAWNGSYYDIYLRGTKQSVTSGSSTHIPLTDLTNVRLFSTGGTDLTISTVAIWTEQLSADDAQAVASNYREAIAP